MTARVQGLTFRPHMRRAHREGVKTETRRYVQASNSHVLPGMFEGVDLETGRARFVDSSLTEMRARCLFESGYRVVTISPRFVPGDLFWERASRQGRRAASRMTLAVHGVHAKRLQDMTDLDAVHEGVLILPASWRKKGTPRDWYARLWDDINGAGSWAENGWVWVFKYSAVAKNVGRFV